MSLGNGNNDCVKGREDDENKPLKSYVMSNEELIYIIRKTNEVETETRGRQ